MIRRALQLSILGLAAVLALVLAGCGGGGSGSGLDEALSYVPKDAAVVIAVDTDTDGDQYDKIDKLLSKFPFGGQVKGLIKQKIEDTGVDYDKDVKPLLGNDVVLSVDLSGIERGAKPGYLVAWKTEDEDAALRLTKKGSKKVGSSDGTDIYLSDDGDPAAAVKDGVVLIADTQEDVEGALKRADGDDHMTEDLFEERLGDLDKDALVRVSGDLQGLLSKLPDGAPFKKQKWLAGIRSFGAALTVEDDGISYDSEVRMEGLSADDLPLAEGDEPAKVVRRAGEIGLGLRNPAQLLRFYSNLFLANPLAAQQYAKAKAKLGRQLGIDLDRDVVDQLTGDATASVALTGGVAFRAQVADPAAAKATLAKVAKRLPKLPRAKKIRVSAPKGGFYTVTGASGKSVSLGIVGENLVIATDPARAAQFAGQSASAVPDTSGAFVFAADAGAIARLVGEKQGQPQVAQIVAASLGDLVGSVEAEPGKITSHYKLNVK